MAPIVRVTLQAALIGAFSNILAQTFSARQANKHLTINWVTVLQFFLFSLVSTPPNILWQEILEQTFPSATVKPMPKSTPQHKPRLSIRNTLAKTLLDQTVGAAVNTVMFGVFMHSLRAAMAHRPAASSSGVEFLLTGRQAFDYSVVDWTDVWARSKGEFWPLMKAGWSFWPLVSVVNFALVKTVAMRNLVGSLAGVGWGVYVSLFTGKRD